MEMAMPKGARRVKRDLKPNGQSISVTSANLEEYISLYIDYFFVGQCQQVLEDIREGFSLGFFGFKARYDNGIPATPAIHPTDLQAEFNGGLSLEKLKKCVDSDPFDVSLLFNYLEQAS
mmetsp:Transcript_13582/g.21210  ORF Transcript_13582/g.21210 Transcript_13582/m.21210 type:complete len:119 (-) Transcript_13582:247-603(-)